MNRGERVTRGRSHTRRRRQPNQKLGNNSVTLSKLKKLGTRRDPEASTEFYRVLPSFIGLYRVLPSFTVFYRVFPSVLVPVSVNEIPTSTPVGKTCGSRVARGSVGRDPQITPTDYPRSPRARHGTTTTPGPGVATPLGEPSHFDATETTRLRSPTKAVASNDLEERERERDNSDKDGGRQRWRPTWRCGPNLAPN